MSQKILSRIYQQLKLTESLLSEGMHWPEDYRKKAFDRIKESALGKAKWYNIKFLNTDLDNIILDFEQLKHIKNSNVGYFLPIIRMFIDYSKNDINKYQEFLERKLDNIIKTLLLITGDPELENKLKDDIKQKWTVEEFEKNTAPIVQAIDKTDGEKLSKISGSSTEYEVILINSYEELHQKFGGDKTGYKGMSKWCHTNGKSTYDSWTKNGTQMFFVLAKKGWENIDPPEPKTTNAFDEYGLSLIAILVRVEDGKLLNATLRWNHVISPSDTVPKTTVDNAFLGWGDISERLDFNVKNEIDQMLKGAQQTMASKNADAKKRIQAKLTNITEITQETFSKEERSVMTSILIPDSVTSIGDRAFYDCRSLTSVTIPNTVTSIGDRAFEDCSGLTSITIPDSVTSIGDNVFYNCSRLTGITIPDSVTSIGRGVFSGCIGLTSVTIPDSMTSIGDWTFTECKSLTSIKIPNRVTSIGYGVFSHCRGLSSLTIPDSVTSIGDHAFYWCSGLSSLTIPDSVTSIGNSAFVSCKALTDLVIPDSVKSIGPFAFSNCDGLTSITISDGVKSIGTDVFYNCSKLASVTFKGKTLDEIESMPKYPWGIDNESIIKVDA